MHQHEKSDKMPDKSFRYRVLCLLSYSLRYAVLPDAADLIILPKFLAHVQIHPAPLHADAVEYRQLKRPLQPQRHGRN